jgi:uncharacterized membrane protein
MMLLLHIAAGLLGLLAGYVALYAAKGAPLHRKAGMVFVYAMLAMCPAGLMISAVRGVAPAINIPAGLLTAYLIITALTTVRPPAAGSRWLEIGAMLVAVAVGLTCLAVAFQALASGNRQQTGLAYPLLMFAFVGLLAGAGDVRVLRSGALRGAPRLARHLWRMCFALFIAALSFFVGQADVFPKPVRIMPLLALPVLAVLVTMCYWLWRVRRRPDHRAIVGVATHEAIAFHGYFDRLFSVAVRSSKRCP